MTTADLQKQLQHLQHKKSLLTSALSIDTVDDGDADIIEMITKQERKLIRKAVLEKHKNAITQIQIDKRGDGNRQTYWQTNAPWTASGKIRRQNQDDLIDALSEHYFGNAVPVQKIPEIPTVAEVFKLWTKDREDLHAVNYLTLVHNRADWNRYFAGNYQPPKGRQNEVKQFERAPFLDKPITQVKASEIIRHYTYLVGDENITKKAFNNAKSLINGVFGHALSLDHNCIDPSRINTRDIAKRCRPEPDNEDQVYTPEERRKILTALEGIKNPTVYTHAIKLSFCLGTRIGELRALHWEDYDLETREIFIHRQITDEPADGRNRVPTEKQHMKGRSRFGKRRFMISEYAAGVLEDLRKLNGDKEYILQSGGNKPISTNRFNGQLKNACKLAGVTYKSSHKTRFGTASALFEAGADERSIQLLLGHSSPVTTRHYDRRSKVVRISKNTIEHVLGL